MEKNKSIDGLRKRPSKTISTPTQSSRGHNHKPTKQTIIKVNHTTTRKPITKADDFLKPNNTYTFDSKSSELKSYTATPNNKSKKTKSKKSTKKISKKRKIITSIILTIVLILIAGVIGFIIWGNDIIAKITGGQGNVLDLITFVEEKYEPLQTGSNGRTNILAFGTSGYNMDGEEGDGVHDGAQLTDSIMVISLDQETGDVAMLSLPRDLKASPTCTATGKINEVYWCNNMDGTDESAGATALMEEVGSILGLDFQYYVHINWGSLIQIVDTLGGIDVTLDEDIYDYDYTGAVYDAGVTYTIDGEEALGIARARHGTTSGDFSRGASQQKILIGIKDKIFTKDFSITDLVSLASTLGDNLRSNFSIENLKTLAHFTQTFDFNSMRQVSLLDPYPLMTTGTINGISYVLPSAGVGVYDDIQEYVAKMFSSDPRDYEDSTILILNGTETPGLAATEQTALVAEGYSNIDISDAPEGTYNSEYTLYVTTNTAPNTQKLLEEKYQTTALPATDLPAGIDNGYTFILIIGDDDKN